MSGRRTNVRIVIIFEQRIVFLTFYMLFNCLKGSGCVSYEKIEYKCPRCGCNEAEVIPTEFGTPIVFNFIIKYNIV